jgi:hypothetical protein
MASEIRRIHNMKNVTVSFEQNGKLVVGVSKKVQLNTLDEKDRIPKILESGLKTDVIEIPKIHGYNRKKYRPLRAGVSCCPDDSGAATMGLIARDLYDNSLVGVSCNHAIGPVYDPDYSVPVGGMLNPTSVVMVQPGPLDDLSAEQIGIGKRCVPMQYGSTGSNLVDAGIFTITGTNMVVPAMCRMWYGGSLPFAHKYEYFESVRVYKSGRTTYLTAGTIFSIAGSVTVTYGTDTAFFTDCIVIAGTAFGLPGDSGSAIVCKIGGQYKTIGILFAGNEDGSLVFACHMDDVVAQLNIAEWDGSINMEQSESGALLIDGICYHDSGEEIVAIATHSPDKTFTDCEECLIDQNRKRLFGNVI